MVGLLVGTNRMGKRSSYERRDKDFYETPVEALKPLLPHLPQKFIYSEPCYGGGAIERGMKSLGYDNCSWRSDLYPAEKGVLCLDAAEHCVVSGSLFITNPPWSRDKKSGYLLHRIIENLANQNPAWLLFDADWMHTRQAVPYLRYCKKIVSVGRVSWMANGQTGKDNCAWYLFDKTFPIIGTEFIGRT